MSAGSGAVVFDCDGLLLDTERCWTRAETELFESFGRVFGREDKRALIGTSREAGGRVLERLLGQPGRARELGDALYELVFAEVGRGASPLPGAVELLRELRGRRPLGVASNSPRALLAAALEGAGLTDAFDVTLGGDEVREPKPAPDIYLLACELLGAEPRASIGLEDSPIGAAAARAAGLFVIGIPTLPELTIDADLVAGSPAESSVRKQLGLS